MAANTRNFCIDAPFNMAYMRDPLALAERIKLIVGVVEVGIFPRMCEKAYFGNDDGTITIQSADGTVQSHVSFDVNSPPPQPK